MNSYKSYRHYNKPHRRGKWLAAAVILIILAAVGLAFWNLMRGNTNFMNSADRAPTAAESEQLPTDITGVKGRYMFSGTIVLARAVENEARTASGVDYSQPFSKFNTFNPDQYDAWEADIECPVTRNYIPYRTQVENTVFNCPPEFLPELRKYVTIANVANNHTRDQGDDGFAETVKNLQAGGLQTIGHWDPRKKDDICKVIALPVRVQKQDGTESEGSLPVAFCAWHYFEKDPLPEEFAVMDRYAKIMPVFAFMQVGVEYRPAADSKQVSVAHNVIDHGAEFIIGNSPHWVQETEVYKGKLVVYSTGNFIFDQLDAETNRGVSIDASMELPYNDNIAKWLALGDKCKTEAVDCLSEAEKQGLQKPELKLVYEAVGSINGYREITQKAPPAVQSAIEERMDWANTKKQLGQ